MTALFIAVSLAMDAFAVSLAVAAAGQAHSLRARFRLAFHFGLFQAGMTALGYLVGSRVAGWIDGFDHWVALALLAYVGVQMVRSGLDPERECFDCDPSRGRTLVMLCVATSLDALAVGLGMAILHTPILAPAIVIGVVTLGLSAFGLRAGSGLGDRFGKRMEVVGGLILIAIGARIVVSHLLA